MFGLAFISAFIVLLGAAAPPAVTTGVSYDQVSIVTRTTPLARAADFQKTYDATLATLLSGAMTSTEFPPPHVQRIAWLGTMSRLENPVTGVIVIHRPDDHRTIVIDSRKRTYTIISSNVVSDTYSVPFEKAALATSPAPTNSPVPVFVHSTSDAFPDAVVDGITYKGVAQRITQTVSDPSCKYSQALHFVVLVYDPQRTDPGIAIGFYANWLQATTPTLARLSGCNLATPLDPYAPIAAVYPHFLLYSMVETVISRNDRTLVPMPSDEVAVVTLRGNVRTLTAADTSLFEAPAGYTEAQSASRRSANATMAYSPLQEHVSAREDGAAAPLAD